MISAEKNPLTPRETTLRMLEHMPDDVSYDDVLRQVRILQDIENTLNDVEMAGSPADAAVEKARHELDEPDDGDPAAYRPPSSSVVLRSRSSRNWKSLADRSDPAGDAVLRGAQWHH